MPDARGDPVFAADRCPLYDGDGAKELEPECCENPLCDQRDWQRNALLLFEKYSATYASLCLLRWHTAQVWTCDDAGHTINCPNPECVFGGQQIERTDAMIQGLEQAIVVTFSGLAHAALDLRTEWSIFAQIEEAAMALDTVAAATVEGLMPTEAAVHRIGRSLGILKSEAVENDPADLRDLFSPIQPGGRP